MKKEELKVGTEVYLKFVNGYRKAVVIEPTYEPRYSGSVMVRVPVEFSNGERLIDMETFPEMVYSEEEVYTNTKVKRIYISGAINHLNYEERYKAFEEVENKLAGEGYEVFNPMKNGLPKDSTTAQHMRRDLSELTREDKPYDAIYMMKGWNHSAGFWTEFRDALAIGLEVIFEQIGKPIKFE